MEGASLRDRFSHPTHGDTESRIRFEPYLAYLGKELLDKNIYPHAFHDSHEHCLPPPPPGGRISNVFRMYSVELLGIVTFLSAYLFGHLESNGRRRR